MVDVGQGFMEKAAPFVTTTDTRSNVKDTPLTEASNSPEMETIPPPEATRAVVCVSVTRRAPLISLPPMAMSGPEVVSIRHGSVAVHVDDKVIDEASFPIKKMVPAKERFEPPVITTVLLPVAPPVNR
jgi:hypothetical protein